MGYKTILTVLSRPTQISLLDDAETLATREDAHLDILCLGVDLSQAGYYFPGGTPYAFQEALDAAMEAASGLVDPPALMGHAPPYAIPEMLVDCVPADVGIPVGRLRGNGEIHPCFATESFVDEVARANRNGFKRDSRRSRNHPRRCR